MDRLTGKTVLVTGASSGIGRAVALSCAQAQADVALVARSRGALNAPGHSGKGPGDLGSSG